MHKIMHCWSISRKSTVVFHVATTQDQPINHVKPGEEAEQGREVEWSGDDIMGWGGGQIGSRKGAGLAVVAGTESKPLPLVQSHTQAHQVLHQQFCWHMQNRGVNYASQV